jgi:4-aminobutyrate aminotransferase-like enzyme
MNKTRRILDQLRAYESRNVTFMEPDGSWPIVWDRAEGVHVWDADGRKYLDLTAAFGVAAAGHANPRVVKAGREQLGKLPHAMGDVHPHALKTRLARELSRLTFERWKSGAGKVIFCNSGFEAVEAALKTALLATNRPGIIAFEKAYHGLGYGALNATHREHFRLPFRAQLGGFASFVEFPSDKKQLDGTESAIRGLLRRKEIGAILVEPAQVRGGINTPPPGFLPLLRQLCNEHGALLILDEIYTGFGRTGKWFACEHSRAVPDLICLGKGLTGGFPLSACVGRAEVMDAWPESTGEAIHTSTYLGHPVGCAMALAQIEEIRARKLLQRGARLGEYLLMMLKMNVSNPGLEISFRGLGLMAGVELCLPGGAPATMVSLRAIKEMLHRGFILLPEGEDANVISFTPPLTISEAQIKAAVVELGRVLRG